MAILYPPLMSFSDRQCMSTGGETTAACPSQAVINSDNMPPSYSNSPGMGIGHQSNPRNRSPLRQYHPVERYRSPGLNAVMDKKDEAEIKKILDKKIDEFNKATFPASDPPNWDTLEKMAR